MYVIKAKQRKSGNTLDVLINNHPIQLCVLCQLTEVDVGIVLVLPHLVPRCEGTGLREGT
jgi:hypothetical protein